MHDLGDAVDAPARSEDYDPATLVAGIRQGNKEHEERFVAKYRRGVVLLLEQRTRDRARAEDLAHEALLTVLSKLRDSGLENPTSLTQYLYQTAKYIHIGWQRRSANQVDLRDNLDDVVEESETFDQQLIRRQRVELVRKLIDEMSVPRDRELLRRYYVLEQPKPVICEALALTAIHFDRVLNRARKRFGELAQAWRNELVGR